MTSTKVNEILTTVRQTLPVGFSQPSGEAMVLRFIYSLWSRDNSLPGPTGATPRSAASIADGADADDADAGLTADARSGNGSPLHEPDGNLRIANAAARRRQRRDETRERTANERLIDERIRAGREDSDLLVAMWIASHQSAIVQLSNDIDDARRAARLAYEPALKRQEHAREELQAVQQNAIVLRDGRRVYFTQDGTRLYGDDGVEIASARWLEEARQKATEQSPTFETHIEKEDGLRSANARVESLTALLDQLDELAERTKSGRLTSEKFEELRRETDRIIQALPSDAREEMQRLRKSREAEAPVIYRDVGAALTAAPDLGAQFAKAYLRPLPEPSPQEMETDHDAGREPAYKPAPDY